MKKNTPTKKQSTGRCPKTRAEKLTLLSMLPEYSAAAVMQSFSVEEELDYLTLADALQAQCNAVRNGNLSNLEDRLTSQAASLEAIFVNLALQAQRNMGEFTGTAELYMKLALRAQNQCRATLATLAEIKNPSVVIAKQANISHGPQQVNNECSGLPRAEQIQNPPNELLELEHEERLDSGAETPTGDCNKEMESMGALHGTAHGRRKGSVKPK